MVRAILARCGARGDCRLWPNATGVGRGLSNDGVVRFGLVGSTDIIGLSHHGRFLAMEVKTGGARQSPQQKAFQAMIEKFGGLYAVVRQVDEAEKWLDSSL